MSSIGDTFSFPCQSAAETRRDGNFNFQNDLKNSKYNFILRLFDRRYV